VSVGPYVHQTPERESPAPAARESSEWRVPESRNSVVISLLDHRSRSDAPDDAAVCTSGRGSGVPKADRRTARTSAGASAQADHRVDQRLQLRRNASVVTSNSPRWRPGGGHRSSPGSRRRHAILDPLKVPPALVDTTTSEPSSSLLRGPFTRMGGLPHREITWIKAYIDLPSLAADQGRAARGHQAAQGRRHVSQTGAAGLGALALVGLPPPGTADTGRAARRQCRTAGNVGQAHGFEPTP